MCAFFDENPCATGRLTSVVWRRLWGLAGFFLLALLGLGAEKLLAAPVRASTTVSASSLLVIQLTALEELQFGRLIKPSSGTTSFKINNPNGSITVSGGNGMNLDNGVSGSIKVQGTPAETFTLQISDAVCDDPNMTFKEQVFWLNGTPGTSFVFAEPGGENVLRYGGNLTVGAATKPGYRQCMFYTGASY